MKKISLCVVFLLACVSSFPFYAQEEQLADSVSTAGNKITATLEADLVSSYIWRGERLAHFSVQPTLGLSWRGLSLSAWGSVGLVSTSDMKELDFTLSYTNHGFTIGVNDYWNDLLDSHYFEYRNGKTCHSFEAFVSYDFGFMKALWATIFAGADGLNSNNKRAYSSYFELAAPFRLATCDWVGTVGFVPYTTSYYDTRGFAVTNVSLRATKDIPISSKFKLPLFLELIANPYHRDMYFVAGLTIRPFQH